MFTLATVKAAHAKVKSGADFPAYIQDLKALGVTHYETFVSDGRASYHGAGVPQQITEPKYNALEVASEARLAQFKASLAKHQQGHTDYHQFCEDCAAAGVDKWTVSLEGMTCTYFDQAGNKLLVEAIPG